MHLRATLTSSSNLTHLSWPSRASFSVQPLQAGSAVLRIPAMCPPDRQALLLERNTPSMRGLASSLAGPPPIQAVAYLEFE